MSTILTHSAYLQAMAAQHDGSTVPEIIEHRKRLDEIALLFKARGEQVEVLREALTKAQFDKIEYRRKVLFDFAGYLECRAANHYHGNPRTQALCDAENKLILEWSDDALLELLAADDIQYEIKEDYAKAKLAEALKLAGRDDAARAALEATKHANQT